MKALLLAHDFPPLGGGIARWMAEFARRSDLVVSTGSLPGADDRPYPGGVDRLWVATGRLKTLPGQWFWRGRAESLIRRHRARFVWAGNIRPAGAVALWAGRRDRVPVGLMVHGGDLLQLAERYRRNPRRRRLARRLLGDPDVVVANSQWTADLARQVAAGFGAELGDRLVVVPLGSDPDRFRPGRSGEAWRQRQGLPDDRLWLVTVARLVPHKGIDRGIEVVSRLRHLYPELAYLVAGEGPDRSRLERVAREAGVADRVHLVGSVPEGELPAVHAMAHLYLGLSREEGLDVEGFGISLADAAACAVAVVAGSSGGTADAVDHGVTGLLVPPDDAAAIASAVDGLLGDPERRAAMGRAGRHWVETSRNWARVAADLERISRSVGRGTRR